VIFYTINEERAGVALKTLRGLAIFFLSFFSWKNHDRNNRSCEFKGLKWKRKKFTGPFCRPCSSGFHPEDDCALNTFNIAFY